jgi:A/G-specific adenine glycosylase
MMDLGATICTPKRPACAICPLRPYCVAAKSGDTERFPIKAAKAERPARKGAAFVAIRDDGSVLLRKRPESGLLGGMVEPPTTAWSARADGDISAKSAPLRGNWEKRGTISHVFTHFSLQLTVYAAEVGNHAAPAGHWWSAPDALPGEALPTVMKKVIEAAIEGALLPRRPGASRKT